MSNKPYEPHPRLGMKVVPSKTDYDRSENLREIEEQQKEFAETEIFGGDTGIDADFYYAEQAYEQGFHPEMPEN